MSTLRKTPDGKALSGLPLEVFDRAPMAVAVFRGRDLVLAYLNDAYRSVFGERPLGRPVREAFADLAERWNLDLLDRVFETGEQIQMSSAPVTIRYSDGRVKTRFFAFSLSPIETAGSRWGILSVSAEVTGHVEEAEHARSLAEERHYAIRRYQSLVAADTRVWVADPEGRLLEDGGNGEETSGQPWEELRGDGWLGSAHPDDRAGLAESWYRAVAEVPDLFEYVYRTRQPDGGYRHCRLRAAPVRENDQVVEWVGASTDIEEQWLRERRGELLGRAARAVSESHSAPEAFAALSPLIVPTLADECGIYLLPEPAGRPRDSGSLVIQRVAATAREGLPPDLPPRGEQSTGGDHAITRAARERRPLHLTFPPGEIPADFAPPGARPWLRLARAHSGVILPVLVDGTVAAVAAAFVCGERAPIGSADRDLMRELIEQAHAPLSHALDLQRTQQVARALQHSLLTEPPRPAGLRIAVRYLPSPAAAEVGGDWYDSFVLPDGATVLIIGDVAGHDLEAAVTMSRMRNMLRGLAADRRGPPGEVLDRLDRATQLLNPEEGTATCVLGRVEGPPDGPWRLDYSAAGHPPPLLVTGDGRARFLEEARNLILGGPPTGEPRTSAVHPLPPESTLLLYTDGLVERREEHLDQGLERLRRHAAALAREPVEGFCDALLTESSSTGRDDIALLALRLPAGRG